MSFFETISSETNKRNLRYLVIGGLALSYMKKYPLRSPTTDQLNDKPALELPVAPDFLSRPPQINPQAMLRRIAENIAWRNNRPGEADRRAAERIPVEFVL